MNIESQVVDSDLGRWALTSWEPPAGTPLARAVSFVWDFQGRVTAPRERVFPNGGVELLLQLDDRYRDIRPVDGETVLTPATCVTGVHTGSFVIEAPPRPCRVIGVRLRPPAAWAVLGHPLSELSNRTTDLGLLLGRDADELAERCHELGTGPERVRRVVAWLAARLSTDRAVRAIDPAVRHVTESISRTAGRDPIGPMREETGLSAARLADRFREQVGVTPKRYARIQRFQRTLRMLAEPDCRAGGCAEPSLAEVAVSAGYYDQPHMNREFRRMAGLTPGEYLRSRRFPESPHLAESASP